MPALKTARAIIRDLSARTLEREDIGGIVAYLNAIELEHGDAGADVAEAVYARFPYLLNYDAKGNWCGPMAHENGWTA